MKRLVLLLSITAIGVALSTPAEASSVTFTFNCQSGIGTPANCAPGGPFGTLTLADSAVDPNRVDISWNLTPAFGATLERLYLNWTPGVLTNYKFYLIDPATAPGVASNTPFASTLGTVLYSNGTQSMGHFGFDLTVNPNNPGPFVFSGSLALYNQLPNPDLPANLDVANFIAASSGTGTPPLYAAYRTNNFGNDGEFWTGATVQEISTNDVPVPEPASMLLLGSGLLAAAARRRRSRKAL